MIISKPLFNIYWAILLKLGPKLSRLVKHIKIGRRKNMVNTPPLTLHWQQELSLQSHHHSWWKMSKLQCIAVAFAFPRAVVNRQSRPALSLSVVSLKLPEKFFWQLFKISLVYHPQKVWQEAHFKFWDENIFFNLVIRDKNENFFSFFRNGFWFVKFSWNYACFLKTFEWKSHFF